MSERHCSTFDTAFPCQHCRPEIEVLRERISELEDEIANLRRLEDVIQRNTALFQAMISHSRDGIVLTGPDGRIVRVVHALAGHAPDNLRGVNVEKLVHEDDRQIVRDCYRQLLNRVCATIDCEVRIVRPDDSFLWAEATITDMLDEPSVQAFVCNYSDITERKLHELELAEFAAIVHSSDYGIFSEDTRGCILTWNPAAERIFGYGAAEMIGRGIGTLIPDDLAGQETEARAGVCRTARATAFRSERMRKDGVRIPIQVRLAPVLDRYGRVRGLSHISRVIRDQS